MVIQWGSRVVPRVLAKFSRCLFSSVTVPRNLKTTSRSVTNATTGPDNNHSFPSKLPKQALIMPRRAKLGGKKRLNVPGNYNEGNRSVTERDCWTSFRGERDRSGGNQSCPSSRNIPVKRAQWFENVWSNWIVRVDGQTLACSRMHFEYQKKIQSIERNGLCPFCVCTVQIFLMPLSILRTNWNLSSHSVGFDCFRVLEQLQTRVFIALPIINSQL